MITGLFTRRSPAWRPQLPLLLISCYVNLLSHDLLFVAGWWAAVLMCSYKSFLSCKSYSGADVRIWKPPSRASSLKIKPSYTQLNSKLNTFGFGLWTNNRHHSAKCQIGVYTSFSETWIPNLLCSFFVDVASWHFVLLYHWLNEEGVIIFSQSCTCLAYSFNTHTHFLYQGELTHLFKVNFTCRS